MSFSWNRRAASAAALAVLALAACTDRDGAGLLAPEAAVVEARVYPEVSSLRAAPGERVAVAVRAESRAALGGVQGFLRYDPSALRYLGHAAGDRALVLVNDAAAARGELRLIGMSPAGMGEGDAPVLVFEVLRGGYADALRFSPEVVATREAERVGAVRVEGARQGGPAAVPAATTLSWREWAARLGGPEAARELRRLPGGPSFVPGQYVADLRFGDPTLNGSINFTDASYVASVSVGNSEIIIGTDAPARDAVVAANVRPVNGTGLGEPGDPLAPGIEADGSREINLLDALAVAREAVGTDQTVVGELIPGRGPAPVGRRLVSAGSITGAETWSNDTIYELTGIVRVNGGGVLTIEPGTRIEGRTGTVGQASENTALFVERDGRLVADGTALQPIVFTCTAAAKFKGCWGGVFVAGNAPVNDQDAALPTSPAVAGRAAGGCNQKQGEGGAPAYGGCNAADSSGVLRYLVIEYAGFLLSANNELNGLTLGGIGTGTVVENIQVHGGLDDGVEIFGGTVNVRRLYLTANSDDSFDYSFGWNGNAQFLLIQHDSLDADKGFEVDNTENSATYGATPRTLPTIFNVTFVGPESPSSTSGAAGNNSNDALHIRRGAGGAIRNAVVLSSIRVLDIDDAQTCAGIGSAFAITNSILAGNAALGNTDADPACGSYTTPDVEQQFLQDAANANTVIASASGVLRAPFDVRLPDFRPVAGSAAATAVGATPPSGGFFDTSATYVGAVPPANGTGSNIPWYAGWTRGWQSATAP